MITVECIPAQKRSWEIGLSTNMGDHNLFAPTGRNSRVEDNLHAQLHLYSCQDMSRALLFVCRYVSSIPLAAAHLSILLLAQMLGTVVVVLAALLLITNIINFASVSSDVILFAEYSQIHFA